MVIGVGYVTRYDGTGWHGTIPAATRLDLT